MIWPMVCRGLSEPYGFCATNWILRSWSRVLPRTPGGRSLPPNMIVPVKSLWSPTTHRASVVLPDPEVPTIATAFLAPTSRLMSRSTRLVV